MKHTKVRRVNLMLSRISPSGMTIWTPSIILNFFPRFVRLFCNFISKQIGLPCRLFFLLKPHSNKNVKYEVQKHQPSQQKEIVSQIMIFTIDMIFIWVPFMSFMGCSCDCVHNTNKSCPKISSQTYREQMHANDNTLKRFWCLRVSQLQT